MNTSRFSTDSPAQNPDARRVEDLWPILRDTVRARRPLDLSREAHDTLSSTADTGWQLKGLWDPAARQLFDLFKPLLDFGPAGAGWVIAQLGQSLDGCVATRSGDSSFINGAENLLHLHRLRAVCDAVIVGAGTVAIDNPQLTTRNVHGPNPVRVLLDPGLRLIELVKTARVFNDGQAATLWVCDARWGDQAIERIGADRVLAVSTWCETTPRCTLRGPSRRCSLGV